MAQRWIDQGFDKTMVLNFVGVAISTYYEYMNRECTDENKVSTNRKNKGGRHIQGYSYHLAGSRVNDEQIVKYLIELIEGDGFPYGYHKLTTCLKEDYMLVINHKKVYRLCKENGLLKPKRKRKPNHPRRLAKRNRVTAPNQLWEMDLKYGYIEGENRFYFQLSLML